MMIHCKNCKKKFFHSNENDELEGKVIQCKFCDEQWLYVTRTKYLENRLMELNQDLDNTESKINLRKIEIQDQINQLDEDLNKKKTELDEQKLLIDKVTAFENRLKETEKLNAEELELQMKAGKIKKQIKATSDDISNQNKDIEEKANYLESKINSYNKDEFFENKSLDQKKSKTLNNDVIDININKNFNKLKDDNLNKSEDNKEKKRGTFFSPDFLK
tara:strand:- start:10 stop:663 length:654 start_codon:yes stop_codon:yes gene_type:complete